MYDRLKAKQYAIKWALSRNPLYFSFDKLGGDCTNYISQCLFAGGIAMNYAKNGWFYENLSNRAPAWTGVDEFFNFAILNSQNSGPRCRIIPLNECEVGDVIQLKNNSEYYHSLFISEVKNSRTSDGVFVCSHDNNRLNARLSEYFAKEMRVLKIFN